MRAPDLSTRIGRSKYAFLAVHLAAVGFVIAGDVEPRGAFLVWFTMQFAIHAGYHRCFAHRSFRTHPIIETMFACVGLADGPSSLFRTCFDRYRQLEMSSDGILFGLTN